MSNHGRAAGLAPSDLAEFLRQLDGYSGTPQIKLAFRLLMLTLVRPGELRLARWSQFHFQTGEWRVPTVMRPGRGRLAGDVHIVPLSGPALDTILELRQYARDGDLLFPGRHDPQRPIDESALRAPLYRVGYRGRVTALSFRKLAADVLAGHGWSKAAVRELVGLSTRRMNAANPDAASTSPEERRQMLEQWADFVDAQRG